MCITSICSKLSEISVLVVSRLVLKADSCVYDTLLTNQAHEPFSHVLVIFSSVEAHEPQWLLAKLFLSQYLIDDSLLLLQETECQPVFQAERINEYPFLFIILLLLTISARWWLAYGCRFEGCLLWRGSEKVSSSIKTVSWSEQKRLNTDSWRV